MKTDYYPLYDDTEDQVAELSADDAERARTLKSSLEWYRRQNERSGGWVSQIERCETELEELTGSSDVAQLDELLGTEDRPGKSERQKEMEDLQETAEWMDEHGWDSEHVWDELRELKGGKEG